MGEVSELKLYMENIEFYKMEFSINNACECMQEDVCSINSLFAHTKTVHL